MSVTVISYVIAGCEVTDKLHRDVELRGCEHSVAASNFCPQCGKPMWQTERRAISGYDGDVLVIDEMRLKVVTDAKKRHFVGIVLAEVCDWKEKVTRVEKIDAAAFYKLRDALTSVKLWDPDTYAIWNVLYVSW